MNEYRATAILYKRIEMLVVEKKATAINADVAEMNPNRTVSKVIPDELSRSNSSYCVTISRSTGNAVVVQARARYQPKEGVDNLTAKEC